MTAEEYQALMEMADWADNSDSDNKRALYTRRLKNSIELVQADIARQLTRIADAMDDMANPLYNLKLKGGE